MPEPSKMEKVWHMLQRLIVASPGGLPYLGPAYTQIRADADAADIKYLLGALKAMNAEQTRELATLMHATEDQIKSLMVKIEGAPIPPAQTRMVAVIPTGGRGGAMFPITSVMPKCLVYIDDRPMLQIILNTFLPFKHVIKKVIVVTRSFTRAIRESIRQGGYGDFVDCREIDKQVPGALLDLQGELQDGPFLLHYSDILIPGIDWAHVKRRYDESRELKGTAAMLLCSSYYRIGIGVITENVPELLGSFDEKPVHMRSNALANLGVGVFAPLTLGYLRNDDEGIFEKSLSRLLGNNQKVALYRVAEWEHVHELRDLYDVQKKHGAIP